MKPRIALRQPLVPQPKKLGWVTIAVGLALIASACGGSDQTDAADDETGTEAAADDNTAAESTDDGDTTDDSAADDSAASDSADENGATESGPTGGEEAALNPGGSELGQVTIDGTTIDYVAVVPDGFQPGDTAPVLLALPPGGQDLGIAQSFTKETYAPEAVARGWVVISPAAPNGELFFQGSEDLIPGLMNWVETWATPEAGVFHIAGISNGGISSFRIAGQNPDRVASVTVFPGFPSNDADTDALSSLTGIPVRMFVGSRDADWIEPMEEAQAALEDLGGDVQLEIVADSGHIIPSLSDGVRVFDELDAAR